MDSEHLLSLVDFFGSCEGSRRERNVTIAGDTRDQSPSDLAPSSTLALHGSRSARSGRAIRFYDMNSSRPVIGGLSISIHNAPPNELVPPLTAFVCFETVVHCDILGTAVSTDHAHGGLREVYLVVFDCD